MNTKIKIADSAHICSIDIEGVIGVDEASQFDSPAERVATYEKFRKAVARIADIESPEVVVNIRSAGGDVNDALLIYEALAALDARITTRCYGYTASAATIIAQAASEGGRQIAPSALYLVHRSSCATEGNAEELAEHIELLRKTDEVIASLYASRSGHPKVEFETLMSENGGRGRWLSPEEALQAGLVDEIIGEESQKAGGAVSNVIAHISSWLGVAPKPMAEPQTQDINIRHLPEAEAKSAASAILFGEGQRQVAASEVKQIEDPALGGGPATPNEEAYNADARSCFR
ncbi:MAG: Clp protease ClpP [Alistipes sp.]|nr:Clp protease ClpP [Alistipes sp.]